MMPEHRFWAKVNKDGPLSAARPDLGPCWLWTGAQAHGYGRFSVGGRMVCAHRFAYELLVGPIPDDLEIDHLCRVHNCVNSILHMEPVTHQENMRRSEAGLAGGRRMLAKTHCPQGHPYDESNTYHWRGERRCRACNRTYSARRRVAA